MPPFVIFGLPRSRTHWLSRFLTYKDWNCTHDQIRHVRGMDDVKSWLSQGFTGTVETAAAPFWRLLPTDTHVITIRRQPSEVIDSLMAMGIPFIREKIETAVHAQDRKLDQIDRRFPGAVSIRYEHLADELTCAGLFEYCLPHKHDPHWWRLVDRQNIQADMRASLRYQIANAPQMEKAASICAQAIRSAMWNGKKDTIADGMTFQQEPFDQMWTDAQRLFADHCAAVGEKSDEFERKNVDLLRKLDQMGAMQIMTARCNGRMFGYLVTILAPSLEDKSRSVAQQTTFYASSDARGVGMRLQRASIRALQARGGDWDVLQRAGVRGDGARLGMMYKRMGAEPIGSLSRIALRGA